MQRTIMTLSLAALGALADPAGAQLAQGKPINAADAEKMVAACKAFATTSGWHMQIAILNEYGDLIRFEKMDGARRATGTLALEKARTAFRTGRTTREMVKMDPTGAKQFDAVTIFGGVPMMIGDRMVAAVGVSGSVPDNDEACAMKAIEAGGGTPPTQPN